MTTYTVTAGGFTEREEVYYEQTYKTSKSATKLQQQMEARGCRVEVAAA